MLSVIEATLDRAGRGLLYFSNVLLVALFLLINTEIVLRATLGKSTLVSDEYSGYLLCWLTLCGMLYAVRTGAFLQVAFVVNRLRGRGRALAEAVAALGGLFVCGVACYSTAVLTYTTWRFHGVSTYFSETPLYLPQAIMPAAFGLLALAYLVQFIASLRKVVRPDAPPVA